MRARELCPSCARLPRQAYPAAEEANPAAVGKLLCDRMCTFPDFTSSWLKDEEVRACVRTAESQNFGSLS